MRWRFWGESSSTPVPVDDFLDAAEFEVATTAYEDILRGIGDDALGTMVTERLFEAETEGMDPYDDYRLGDTIDLRTSAGSALGTVAEIVESWDSGGYRATPTLEMRR